MHDYEQLSATRRKLIHSLSEAKYRREHKLFVAEGTKCVADTLGAFRPDCLVATASWYDSHKDLLDNLPRHLCFLAKRADMERISNLQTAPEVVAVYHIPEYSLELSELTDSLVLALDRIQDPGNLGTIVRLCDWMGVHHILASDDTVDVYNPKTVQATMGSIARVKVHYGLLPDRLNQLSSLGVPVYGTFLDGKDIYSERLSKNGIVVMGNEGRGISPDVGNLVSHRLFIPPYPASSQTAESLNVAVATALTLNEFRRQLR